MKKIVIGILGNTCVVENKVFQYLNRVYVNKAYVDAVVKNGGAPLLIPYTEDKEALLSILALCDGILFPGGEDLNPRLYGEDPHQKLGVIRPEIDTFCMLCAEYAFENKLPIFGICRGMQLLNVAKGGSLYQDLSLREGDNMLHSQRYNRSYATHQVIIEKGSLLEKIMGTNVVDTNTMHHQSVHLPGNGFKVTASTSDGVVEAIESSDGNIFAVQWHPEELIESVPEMNRLFRYLIKKAEEGK